MSKLEEKISAYAKKVASELEQDKKKLKDRPAPHREGDSEYLKTNRVSPKEVEAAVDHAKESGFTMGAKVKLKTEPEIGEVIGYNYSEEGFYPGNKYPVRVKFQNGEFEYGESELALIK